MEETLFQSGDVVVTNKRFMIGGKTIALAGVVSVSMMYTKPSRLGPIVLLILGVICLSFSAVLGIILIALGGAWLYFQKTVYHVVLESAAGSQEALSSKDEQFIGDVVQAINDAIVSRA